MAYATGPVSDVTRVVSGPSHGRLVPVAAAKAPLKPTATMNASIRATRRVPGRFAMKICIRFISSPPVPFGTSLCERLSSSAPQTSSASTASESKHSYLRQKIATILVSSDHRDLLHLPAFNWIVDDRNYDINGGSDRPLLGFLCCFTHQIFQADQRLRGAVCMDRRNASGMARVPGLQQRQSCRPISDFADNDPVRLKPQRNLETLELVKLRCRQHAQTVGRVEQELLGILDHQHSITGCY